MASVASGARPRFVWSTIPVPFRTPVSPRRDSSPSRIRTSSTIAVAGGVAAATRAASSTAVTCRLTDGAPRSTMNRATRGSSRMRWTAGRLRSCPFDKLRTGSCLCGGEMLVEHLADRLLGDEAHDAVDGLPTLEEDQARDPRDAVLSGDRRVLI